MHLVTVNDYLARRDAEWMGRLYKIPGPDASASWCPADDAEKSGARTSADITYGTNNELGFDYLRDNMVRYLRLGGRAAARLNYAIVDEVDSILIDEARTPLIISGPGRRPVRPKLTCSSKVEHQAPRSSEVSRLKLRKIRYEDEATSGWGLH